MMPSSPFAARPMPEASDVGAPSFSAVPPPAPPIVVPPSMPMPGLPAPAAPPAVAPPSFAPPAAVTQQPVGSQIAQMVPALLMGIKGPEYMGAALRGLQKAKDKKLAQSEHEFQTKDRRTREAADFYGRAVEQSQNITDPVDFENWRQMIAPTAQYYGIDARTFTFNANRSQKSMQSKLVSALETMEKRDPTLAQRDDFRVVTPDYPQGIPAKTVRTWRGEAQDPSGKAILPAAKPDALTPNTPEEQFYAQYAKEHGATAFSGLPTGDQVKAREQWAAGGRQTSTPNVGSFEDYVTRKFGPSPTPAQIEAGRKAYNQADDKPQAAGAGDYREFLMADKLATEWTKASQAGREMNRQFRLMQTGLDRFRQGDKNGGSQAVLVTFQKILDPSSVVRESEYARSADGVSLLARMEGYADRLKAGGAGVPDAELSSMVETAKQFLADMQTYSQGQRARIERTAKQFGVAPELVFDDMPADPTPAPAPKPNAGAATPKKATPKKVGRFEIVDVK